MKIKFGRTIQEGGSMTDERWIQSNQNGYYKKFEVIFENLQILQELLKVELGRGTGPKENRYS